MAHNGRLWQLMTLQPGSRAAGQSGSQAVSLVLLSFWGRVQWRQQVTDNLQYLKLPELYEYNKYASTRRIITFHDQMVGKQ